MDGTAVQEVHTAATAAWAWFIAFLPGLIAAVLILLIGSLLARWAARSVSRLAQTSGRVDPTLRPVLATALRYAIMVVVGIAALAQLGVPTASVLAVLGAAGLAIGLALQGTLANIAAGIMLLWLRPFSAGEFIETDKVRGTIEEVGLFHTQIRTWDGLYTFVPNSQLWNVPLTNLSRNPTRMVILDFDIGYGDDMAEARRILVETALGHRDVLAEPAPIAVPLTLGENAVTIQLRAWAPAAKFWQIRWELTHSARLALEKVGITFPIPRQVLHVSGSAGAADPPAPPPPAMPPAR